MLADGVIARIPHVIARQDGNIQHGDPPSCHFRAKRTPADFHVNYAFCSLFYKKLMCQHILAKPPNIEFHENPLRMYTYEYIQTYIYSPSREVYAVYKGVFLYCVSNYFFVSKLSVLGSIHLLEICMHPSTCSSV